MTTIADYRTRVLYALGIGGSSSERGFDNNSIDKHTQQAVEEFSLCVPLQASADIAVAGGARSFSTVALARLVRVRTVEYPPDQWPRALLDFSVWGSTVTLDIAPPAGGYTVRVCYDQGHLVDGSGSTIAAAHEHVIVEGATVFAILARAMGAANTAETSTVAPQTYQHLRVAETRLEHWRTQLRTLGGALERRALYTA